MALSTNKRLLLRQGEVSPSCAAGAVDGDRAARTLLRYQRWAQGTIARWSLTLYHTPPGSRVLGRALSRSNMAQSPICRLAPTVGAMRNIASAQLTLAMGAVSAGAAGPRMDSGGTSAGSYQPGGYSPKVALIPRRPSIRCLHPGAFQSRSTHTLRRRPVESRFRQLLSLLWSSPTAWSEPTE